MGDRGHPCFIPDFSGIASTSFPFRMMLAVGLSYIAIIMVIYSTFISTLSKNFTLRHVEFYLRLFLHHLEDHEIFVFKFIFSVYYTYGLVYVEPSLSFKAKANMGIVDNLLDVCLYSACKHYIEYF